jgi:class 3 adenylate cyclase
MPSRLFNAYFDCAAGTVMAKGGQLLDIIGDAILAFFPAGDNGGTGACALALQAGQRPRPARGLKREEAAGARRVRHRVHFGDVVFGNASTERLKFSVLGRAVNRLRALADMAKSLKQPVVVSDGVARRSHARRSRPASSAFRSARRLWAWRLRGASERASSLCVMPAEAGISFILRFARWIRRRRGGECAAVAQAITRS